MKDYCTLRPLVVRVQARMYIFWKFDVFGFWGEPAGRVPGEPGGAGGSIRPLRH